MTRPIKIKKEDISNNKIEDNKSEIIKLKEEFEKREKYYADMINVISTAFNNDDLKEILSNPQNKTIDFNGLKTMIDKYFGINYFTKNIEIC